MQAKSSVTASKKILEDLSQKTVAILKLALDLAKEEKAEIKNQTEAEFLKGLISFHPEKNGEAIENLLL